MGEGEDGERRQKGAARTAEGPLPKPEAPGLVPLTRMSRRSLAVATRALRGDLKARESSKPHTPDVCFFEAWLPGPLQ